MGIYMSRGGAKYWLGIDLPKHVLHLYKGDNPADKWAEYTIYDVIRKKVEKQEQNLWERRRHSSITPCFVRVFKFSDEGCWYITVKTRRKGTVYLKPDQSQVFIERYNLGIFPDLEFRDVWARIFCKKHKIKPDKDRVIQGGKYAWCVLDEYGNPKDYRL